MIDFDKTEGIIFDCDGTLLDSMVIWMNVAVRFLNSKGIATTPEECEKFSQLSYSEAAKYYIENFDGNATPESIRNDVNKLAESFYSNEVQTKENVKDFLEKMRQKNVKMCVATATDKYLIEAGLKRTDLLPYFSEILTCTSVGAGKNNPLIFNEALKHLGTKKENTLIFEDALYAIKTAKNDGFKVVAIEDKSAYRDKEEIKKLADIYIENYKKLTM